MISIGIAVVVSCIIYGILLYTSEVPKLLKLLLTVGLLILSAISYRESSKFYGNPLETVNSVHHVRLIAYYPNPPSTMYVWYIDQTGKPVSIQIPYDFKTEGEMSQMMSASQGAPTYIDINVSTTKTNPLVRVVNGVKITKSKKGGKGGHGGRPGNGDGEEDPGGREGETFPSKQ